MLTFTNLLNIAEVNVISLAGHELKYWTNKSMMMSSDGKFTKFIITHPEGSMNVI